MYKIAGWLVDDGTAGLDDFYIFRVRMWMNKYK